MFIANRPVSYEDLAQVTKLGTRDAVKLAEQLSTEFGQRNSSLEVVVGDSAASIQVKGEYVAPVASLTKAVELSRKGAKILALIAKKNEIKQTELRKYFKGEVYSFVGELKEKGYFTSEKTGNTRLLKATNKFGEDFQLAVSNAPNIPELPLEEQEEPDEDDISPDNAPQPPDQTPDFGTDFPVKNSRKKQ